MSSKELSHFFGYLKTILCLLYFTDPVISIRKDTLSTLCSEEEQKDTQKQKKETSSIILHNEPVKQISLKRKRKPLSEDQLSNTEETLRVERIRRVMDQEEQIAHTKLKHEEFVSNMKENHLKEMYNLEIQHLKKIQRIEIEIKEAQLKASKSENRDKENIDIFVTS